MVGATPERVPVVGGAVVGATVDATMVVGAMVVGATVVGATVVGGSVVGVVVVGSVVGVVVVGAVVVGVVGGVGVRLMTPLSVVLVSFFQSCSPGSRSKGLGRTSSVMYAQVAFR